MPRRCLPMRSMRPTLLSRPSRPPCRPSLRSSCRPPHRQRMAQPRFLAPALAPSHAAKRRRPRRRGPWAWCAATWLRRCNLAPAQRLRKHPSAARRRRNGHRPGQAFLTQRAANRASPEPKHAATHAPGSAPPATARHNAMEWRATAPMAQRAAKRRRRDRTSRTNRLAPTRPTRVTHHPRPHCPPAWPCRSMQRRAALPRLRHPTQLRAPRWPRHARLSVAPRRPVLHLPARTRAWRDSTMFPRAIRRVRRT